MVENAVDKPAVLEHPRCVVAIITGSQLARIMAMPYFIVDLLNVKVESSIMRLNPCSISVAVSPRDMTMSKSGFSGMIKSSWHPAAAQHRPSYM